MRTASATFWLAVGLSLAANVLLPLQDALTKGMIERVPIWEVMLVRSATVLCLCLVRGRGALLKAAVASPFRRALLMRGSLMLGGWWIFYVTVQYLPLGQAITLYFTSPVLVSLLAGPLLGERLRFGHWVAVGLGFFGVAITSGIAHFDASIYAGLALVSAVLWALSMLLLRRMSAGVSVLLQVTCANAIFVVATGCAALVFPWAGRPIDLVWMAGIGLIGGAGQYALYEAARWVPAPVLATLEYTAIVSAFLLGYWLFGEVPTPQVLLGACVVLASGILVIFAERTARAEPQPAT